MAYLSNPFEHDMFVSYAHGRADRQGVKGLKHWSERLTDELEGEIVDLLPEFETLDIFMDRQLDPTQPLTALLRREVSGSGLLLVIMSEHYLKSAWCRDERDWFATEVGRRYTSGGLVLVVRVQPTNHADWPVCLKDERGYVVVGFQFHPNPRHDELVLPHGWPEPLPQDRAYYEELGKLASIVTQRLRQLKKAQELEQQAQQPRVQIRIEGEPRIYLHAPISTAQAWAEAKVALGNAGCRVFPGELPVVGTDLVAINAARKERLKILSNQVHALCLLSVPQANGIEREIEAIASDRVALQAFDKDLPCAIIDRRGGGVPRAHELGIDIIEAQDENWLLPLQDWLKGALGHGG
jgi:TIR domain